MPTVTSARLHALSRAMCAAAGSGEREAAMVADHLVEANLTGHDSHGVGLLPIYFENVRAGRLVPNRHAEPVGEHGAVLTVEGHRGYGQVIGHEAMALGMARAKEHGVALLALRNSFHLGRIGHYAEQCARGGFASLHFVNVIDHPPLQAPHAGGEARFSTNPFCAALPGEDGPALLLDMATSKIAIGKARVARNQGLPVPDDSLLDPAGRPTRDPAVMFQEPRGALVAMGEHKGSGLAILCELLAGALTGGRTIQPAHPQRGGIINNMLSVIIDPEVFGSRGALVAETRALLAYVKSARPRAGFDEVLVPGEPERRRRAERLARGIEIDERTWAELMGAAETLGLDTERLHEPIG
jgi:hydroxycarboxylate dehydrogenase B